MNNIIFDVLDVYFQDFIMTDFWNPILIGAIACIPIYIVIRLIKGV